MTIRHIRRILTTAAHELKIYEKPGGGCQVRDYLRKQNKAVRGEAGWLLKCLEDEGDKLDRPITDYLEDGIYELRIIVDGNQHRILYFFHGNIIVATNAFLKKTRKVRPAEIDRAKKARVQWLEREAGK